MAEFNTYPPGTFCWVDLATSDAEAAKAFYTELFGWTAIDIPTGETGVYTMLQQEGKDVCALYQMDAAMEQQGIPPHWLSYVSVASADDSSDRVKQLGGTVLQPPFEVMDAGRMALVRDPTGAIFALWQPRQHPGATLVNVPVSLGWNELQTKDPSTAIQFYTDLFGWTAHTSKAATGGDYTEFKNGDRPAAGLIETQPAWGEVPPNWVIYFVVANCDATIAQAVSLGASLGMPPLEIEDVGRFALLQDPQGACFTVIQLQRADD